jgi:hypothetical protein
MHIELEKKYKEVRGFICSLPRYLREGTEEDEESVTVRTVSVPTDSETLLLIQNARPFSQNCYFYWQAVTAERDKTLLLKKHLPILEPKGSSSP